MFLSSRLVNSLLALIANLKKEVRTGFHCDKGDNLSESGTYNCLTANEPAITKRKLCCKNFCRLLWGAFFLLKALTLTAFPYQRRPSIDHQQSINCYPRRPNTGDSCVL